MLHVMRKVTLILETFQTFSEQEGIVFFVFIATILSNATDNATAP